MTEYYRRQLAGSPRRRHVHGTCPMHVGHAQPIASHAADPALHRTEAVRFQAHVRARIMAIALIPVVGFLATGIAFVSGEREVDAAFSSVQRATALADASREFKSAVGAMQSAARSFAVRPQSS